MYKAGYIQKRGDKNKGWKTRWMVTEADGLAYYKKENKDRMGYIDLHHVMEVRTPADGKHKNVLNINTPDRVWVIACSSAYERDQWIEVIEKKRAALSRPRFTVEGNEGSKQMYATNPNPLRRMTMQDKIQDKIKSELEDINKQISKNASVRNLLQKKDTLGRSIAKFQVKLQETITGLPPIGKLYVTVEEATFSSVVEPTARPVVSATFEEQYIVSNPSKNSENPRWKEVSLFQVANVESRFHLKIMDSTTNNVMGMARIPIKRVTELGAIKQFYDLTIKDDKKNYTVVGRALLSLRYEANKTEETGDVDVNKEQETRVGSFHIIVFAARNLKPRKYGAPRSPCVFLSYDKQNVQSDVAESTNDPKWDYGTIFSVSSESARKNCLLRVMDMDNIHQTHLGTVVVKPEMLESSLNSEIDTWLPLEIGDDDPNQSEVQGELHVLLRYKLARDEVVQAAVSIPVDEGLQSEVDTEETDTTLPETEITKEGQLQPEEVQKPVRSETIRVGTQRQIFAEKLTGSFSLDTAINQVSEIYDVLYKVIIIGNSGVGKTNLLGRWLDNRFATTSATINVEFGAKLFNIDGKIVKVQLWDTAGQEQYRAVTRSYYRKSHGAVLVYDITDSTTFEQVASWLQDIREANGNEETQILLVGNKIDLEFARKVSTQEGIELAAKEGLNFMETSALSGNNVQRAFQIVLQDIHALAEKKLGSEKPMVNLNDKETINLDTTPSQEESSCCGGTTTTTTTTITTGTSSTSEQDSPSIFQSFSSLFSSN